MTLTPKEKAAELVRKFAMYLRANLIHDQDDDEDAKECALIAVDEIIDALDFNQWQNAKQIDYWKEVKQEIEKL